MMFEPVPSRCVLGVEECRANATSSTKRGLRVCGWSPKRKGPLAIVGSAPSVSEYLDELRAWPGEIWAINGAYRFLLNKGIHVHGFVGLDPVPGLKEYVEQRDPMTAFLLASVCDPAVFDELAKADVWLWHSRQSEFPYPQGSQMVGGGTTCLTRAPWLAHMLGWRDITVFGGDSSFAEDSSYCYRQGTFREDSLKQRFPVSVPGNDQVFLTDESMFKQPAVFGVMQTMFNGLLKFKCGGLLEAFLNSPMHQIIETKDAA